MPSCHSSKLEKGHYGEVGQDNDLEALCKLPSGRENLLKHIPDVGTVAFPSSPRGGSVYWRLGCV